MEIIAAISGESLVNALLWVVIAGVVWFLLNWLVTYIGLPEPFLKVARVVLAILAVLILINALLGLVGHPLIVWR